MCISLVDKSRIPYRYCTGLSCKHRVKNSFKNLFLLVCIIAFREFGKRKPPLPRDQRQRLFAINKYF